MPGGRRSQRAVTLSDVILDYLAKTPAQYRTVTEIVEYARSKGYESGTVMRELGSLERERVISVTGSGSQSMVFAYDASGGGRGGGRRVRR